nr:DMT family transporter [Pacificibacter maritimus]
MLLFSFLVAGSFSLGGVAMKADIISPLAITSVRFIIATLGVGLLAMATGGISKSAMQAPWRYGILGALFALYFIMMFTGLETASAISISAMFTLTPVLSAGIAYILLRQITTRRVATALSVGALGALWVVFEADISALLAFELGRGEMLYFIGIVAHAIYTPLASRFSRGERAPEFVFFIMIATTAIVLAVSIPDIMATDWSALPMLVWFVILYIALVATTLTGTILIYATMRLDSAKVMAYTYLTPSWVILWEIALGQGVPPVMIFGGIALTTLALYLLLKHEEKPAPIAVVQGAGS